MSIHKYGIIGALAAVLALAAPGYTFAQTAETVIEVAGPQGALKGLLLAPGGAAGAAAIVIPGSGPTDLDGNSVLGVKAASYRYLAHGLAAAGIATVRIDKRGMYTSAAAVADPNTVTIAEYASDIGAWADLVKRNRGLACVWLIGHSEGALVALAAAQQSARYCGVVAIAGPGFPFGKLLRQQLQANPANAPLLNGAMTAIDELEAGRRVDVGALHPALQQLFHPKVQGYLIDVMRYDPQELIGKLKVPVLILQGERDLQVSVENAMRLKAASPGARLVLLPHTNHVLKQVAAADPAANLATYADPALPLAPGIVEAISAFTQESRR